MEHISKTMNAPTASIIIRTYNEEKFLGTLLQRIREQTLTDYEIILVDSESTDRTLEIAEPVCDKILHIKKSDFTFGYSLNVGCKAAQGKYLVIVSGHALPANVHWLENLIAPFEQNKKVAMVYGRHLGAGATKFSENQDFKRYWGEHGPSHPLPYFSNNANSALRRDLWQELPFDEKLTGLEDIAWAREMTQRGFRIAYTPDALVHHIHEEKWPQVRNRYRREAIAARAIDLPSPPLGSPHISEFLKNIIRDLRAIFPICSPKKLWEIVLFRYNQWRGTQEGWYQNTQQ